MNNETKQCQNCKQEFVIEPEDFDFYKKIKVPAPTFCPECRTIRRLMFFNEMNLYKTTDFKDGKKIFSGYPEGVNIKVYDRDYWWSDGWNALDYGKDVDFNKSFLEQIKDLNFSVPWPSRSIRGLVNSDYCNNASYFKNCYLCFDGNDSENCKYIANLTYVNDSMDSYAITHSELCYQIYDGGNLFQCFYCSNLENCRNLWFCDECINCNDCFGCFNLRNKNYHIFNKPYTKEEYFKELAKLNTGSYQQLQKNIEEFNEFKLKLPRKYIHGLHNKDVSGDYVYYSKNSFNMFEVNGCENVKYSQIVVNGVKDCYDYTNWGQNSELVYESISCGDNCQNIKFCFDCWPAMQDSEYCLCCHSCSNCFGCMGLKSKQYCILNKQYTKEEYMVLKEKIIQHMKEKGEYGEFFPIEFSPLAYNETMAIDYFPKTKEQAIKEGYPWRDKVSGEYKITIDASDLPDNIKDVSDNILKEVIRCDSCKNAYKIIQSEFGFYKKFLIPLPRFCFSCRHAERRKKKNPMKLYHRQCMCDKQGHSHKDRCEVEFETSYSPDRPEIIYCEQCYNKEVA